MAVLAGTYPISVIRGIASDEIIFQCRDDNATVTGTLSPDATGVFERSGEFNGYPLFILAGAPSYFLYFHPITLTYIIAATLTTGALADGWVLTPSGTEPTGSYVAAGAYTGTATVTDNPVDLTGYTPKAEVRRNSDSDVVLDLQPVLSDGPAGEITIPVITSDDTQDFDFVGTFRWDLVLISPGGDRLGPYVKGTYVVTDNITQIAAV